MANERSRERNRRNQNSTRRSQTRQRVTAHKQIDKTAVSRKRKSDVINNNLRMYENAYERERYIHRESQVGSRRKNEKEKAKRNSSSVMVNVGVLIFIIVVLYLALYTYRVMSTTAIGYDTIELGTIETPYNAEGIVIRNEKVFKAKSAGNVEYECADNEKVQAGQNICRVTNMENMQTMEEELDKINEDLFNVQNYRDELSVHYEEFNKYNDAISIAVDKYAWEFSKKDISGLLKLEDKVKDLCDKRNVLILSDNSGSAKELSGQKKAKEREISSKISTVVSDKGGVISYYADGFEEKYVPALATGENQIAEDEIKIADEIKNIVKNVAETDTPVFKMVYDNEWYIASYIETEYINSWKENDYVTIYITGNTKTAEPENALIKKIILGDKKSYVVFKMNKNISDYITDRIVSIKVSKAEEGYKIINTAITEQNLLEIPQDYIMDKGEDEQPAVIIKNGDDVNTIAVNVSDKDDEKGMYYVQIEYGKLNVGAILLSQKDNKSTFTVENIKTEKGIFITNSGLTKFKKINTENAVINDTHTVLDISLNNNIEIYDRYATDASTITDDEKTVKQKL